MKNQIQTLFGGQLETALHLDGSTTAVKVRQLCLGDYDRAFRFMDDEIAFTAFCCIDPEIEAAKPKSKDWALTLQPESYEVIHAAAESVNAKGFFVYADRRRVSEQQQQERLFMAMAALPPEALAEAMRQGARTLESQMPLPRPRPTPTSH
jgi:hypothetical protein